LTQGLPVSTRRSLLVAGFVLAARSATAAPAPDPAADFIRALGDQALQVIRGGLMLQQKIEYFRQMLRQDFDMPGIARFVLGRYWRVASEAEQQEFERLLEDYIVLTYGRRLADAGGSSLRIIGSRPLPDGGIVVSSEVVREGGAPIRMDWRLGVHGGYYKIEDLSIDGVSMAITQRAEFGAAIQRSGGRVSGLIEQMRYAIANFTRVQPPAQPSTGY
jgi:phospholipid transport system substrate-binding protein